MARTGGGTRRDPQKGSDQKFVTQNSFILTTHERIPAGPRFSSTRATIPNSEPPVSSFPEEVRMEAEAGIEPAIPCFVRGTR